MEQAKSNLKKPLTEAQNKSKEKLIARLLAKAQLDFKCCGNGRCNTTTK